MKFKIFFLSLISLLTSVVAVAQNAAEPVRTKTDTNREVVHTYAEFYLEQKDWNQAEQVITKYITQDQTDGTLWDFLGTAQLEERKFAQACFAFQKASQLLKVKEQKQEELYRYADCLHRGGQAQQAEAILSQLEFASEALNLLHSGTIGPEQPLPPISRPGHEGKHWRVSGAIGFGYDTNVLLVEESLASQLPVSERASPFVNPALQVGYVGKIGSQDFDSRYMASFTDYTATNAKSYNSLYQRGDFILGSGKTRYGIFGETMLMNRDPFQVYLWDAGLSWYRTLSQNDKSSWELHVPIRYQYYPLDLQLGDANNRAGEDAQVELNYRYTIGASSFWLAQFILEEQYTKGQNYRLGAFTAPVTWGVSIPFFEKMGLLNTFSASLAGQCYWASDFARRDFTLKAGAGLIKKVAEGWNTSLDLAYLKNLSSVESARYNKLIVSVFLSHDFL